MSEPRVTAVECGGSRSKATNRASTAARDRRKSGGGARTHAYDRNHVWHPFTQMQEWFEHPTLAIASGHGGWLTDTEGRVYLDGNASIWTNVHGHNDPDLNAALQRQVARVAHSTMLGLTHPVGAELAAELALLAPADLGRVFFSDNGSNAVEIALPLAATIAREEIFSAFLGSYESRRAFFHGHTFTGNPLAAAVALENIRKLRPLVANGILRARIACFGRLLDEVFATHPHVRARAGLDVPANLVPRAATEDLLWGLDRLENVRVEPPAPTGWCLWCGTDDPLLDAVRLREIAPNARLVNGTHHPAGLLEAMAEDIR